MLRSSMLKRMGEKTFSQLFMLTLVGTASETSFGGGAEGPVVRSTRVVGCLKNRGFSVFFISDPSYRHHSKCAFIDRCGVREAARITAYEAKVETIVSQSMQEGSKCMNSNIYGRRMTGQISRLKTGFRSTIIAAREASNDLTMQKNLRLAVYPLIGEMDAPLYRCVIATTIGCNTLQVECLV
jgi:hypothetical protein